MPLTLAALLLAASAGAAPAPAAPAPQSVSFKTSDGWTIAAHWRPPAKGKPVLVLAHGLGSAKVEWTRLAERLQAEGVGTLALDLRGHADSRRGPKGEQGYESFDATGEWPRAVEDLSAAFDWLESRGVAARRISFGGASIGANLAAAAAVRRAGRPCLLLLSAGVDYRGVTLALPRGTKTLAAAAPGDPYAFATMREAAKDPDVETLTAPAGHGVQMFADAATLDKVVAWAVRACAPR